ncbi:DUF928 domain-containing protein [Microcoleus sp. FACHB-831]|uniref:DUF928 domain-containing protein n=1 Tax=Microcoleus sp. FACHB-831 TaxID=2692827 RepID=UPI001683C53D|nr:DUF928 domain-containing protein [Microcoleus sp. FACHB-831]MBD1921285.1 DUF928 domain-containing protein [Microcoleus sp. FACHB-831]
MDTKSVLTRASILVALSVEMAMSASLAIAKPPQSVSPIFNRPGVARPSIRRLKFRIPNIMGASGNREGGAARGGCLPRGESMKAVLPQTTNIGLTASDSPTVFVYIPETEATQAELRLYKEEVAPYQNQGAKETSKEEGNVVAMTTVAIGKTPGIVSVSIPANGKLPLLEVGKKYQWVLTLVCDSEDRAADRMVYGTIQRIPAPITLALELQKPATLESADRYAEAGLWTETVKTLAELRKNNPNDINVARQWSDMLTDAAVGLGEIAQKPIINCCTADSSARLTGEQQQ